MIKPEIIKWAMDQNMIDKTTLADKLGVSENTLYKWLSGEKKPTLNQIQKLAKKLYIPLGYLFSDKPPEFKLTIPDFRTSQNKKIKKPSLELLETVNNAREKQEWLKNHLKEEGASLLKIKSGKKNIAQQISDFLNIDCIRKKSKKYEDFLSNLITTLDKKRIIIIRNGIVGNNTHRPLDPNEFKGFALYDPDKLAHLIFINGKDYKSSQIFTLIHELTHLFLEESGVDGKNIDNDLEQKCNKITAEVLISTDDFKKKYEKGKEQELAKEYKVSVFVILIKARQCGFIDSSYFQTKKNEYEKNIKKNPTTGGNYYHNVKFKAGGEYFLDCVINSTLEGRTLYRDAYQLTYLKAKSFDKYIKGDY